MKLITPDKKELVKYQRESDYLLKECFVGELYVKWTDYMTDIGIEIPVMHDSFSSEWIKTTNYSPQIFHMSFGEEDNGIYKITWNHPDDYKMSEEQIEKVAEIFCIEGWKEEKNYFPHKGYSHQRYQEGFSEDGGDIEKLTKPWVSYLTFQGYRTIVQFSIFNYIKYVHRHDQINSILN